MFATIFYFILLLVYVLCSFFALISFLIFSFFEMHAISFVCAPVLTCVCVWW